MADNNPPFGGRRKALKTIGAGMMAMAGPMIGSTAARSEENVVISIQRDQGNGIGAAEYEKLLSRFTRAAKKKAGLEELAVGKPKLSDGEKIYSLTFIATPGGKAQTYIGSSTNPEDSELQRLHDRSLQFQEEKTVESTGSIDQPTFKPEGTIDPAPEWDPVGSNFWENSDKPYGLVTNSSEVWRYGDDPNYDVYCTTVDTVFEPGVEAWGNNYIWNSTAIRHYWGRIYEPGGGELVDWGPSGDKDGSSSVSASVGPTGAQIGVSYSPPDVYREDDSSSQNDVARWNWTPTISAGYSQFTPATASQIKSDNYASSGDTLSETDCWMTVTNESEEHTISTPLTLQYDS
jgi:hypothetical protein